MQKFRTQLLTAATLLALTGTTYAADMAVRKAPALPPPPPAFSWNGFYVGIAGGAGWGTVESTINSIAIPVGPGIFPVNDPLAQNQMNGWLFGVQAGYNWQATPWLVLGIEGDWDWADIKGTSPCHISTVAGGLNWNCHNKVKWTADVGARVGFVVDRALVYAKGGVAWADTDYNASCAFAVAIG